MQGLATAELALEMNHTDEARAALDRTLAASRKIVTELLGDERSGELAPGDLGRERASTAAADG